jgi:hypothetical protein
MIKNRFPKVSHDKAELEGGGRSSAPKSNRSTPNADRNTHFPSFCQFDLRRLEG